MTSPERTEGGDARDVTDLQRRALAAYDRMLASWLLASNDPERGQAAFLFGLYAAVVPDIYDLINARTETDQS